MECFGGGVNRMVLWDGRSGVDWIGKGDGGGGEDVKLGLGLSWVVIGIGRLCVVCATTETCCKCNKSIQNHAPG